jgi:hypothetical protein
MTQKKILIMRHAKSSWSNGSLKDFDRPLNDRGVQDAPRMGKYLKELGYEPYLCESEDEARELVDSFPGKGKWPCFFTKSDTTGEKDFEEFFMADEILDMDRFQNLGNC